MQAPGFKTIGLFALLAFWRSWRPLTRFNYTHWLFTYEEGPVKRGLVGEGLRRLGVSPTFDTVQILALLLQVLAAVALFWFFTAPARKSPESPGLRWFALWAVTSSATLSRLAWDSGRFDAMGLLLLLGDGRLFALPLKKGLRTGLFLGTGALMIFIHEAQVFLFAPFLGFLAWDQQPDSERNLRSAALFACGWMGLLAFALFWSQVAVLAMDPDAYLELLGGSGVADPLAARIPLRDLESNFRYHFSMTFRPLVPLHHAVFLLGSFPTFVLFFMLFRAAGRSPHRLELRGAAVCASAPLALYLIGLDHFRWWAFVFCLLFVHWGHAARHPERRALLDEVCRRHALWVILAVISGLLLGSLADFNSFALYTVLVERLMVDG